jgi:hypothetical protein
MFTQIAGAQSLMSCQGLSSAARKSTRPLVAVRHRAPQKRQNPRWSRKEPGTLGKSPCSRAPFTKCHTRFRASSSSSVRGQSDRKSRDKLRSARSFPSVWQ